jgi:hypothetical protein
MAFVRARRGAGPVDRGHGFGPAVVAVLLAVTVAGGIVAQEADPAAPARRQGAAAVTADRERAVLAFAGEHHPELVKLFRQLERNAPEEYAKAVAELDRNRERLEKLRARQPDRFDAALAEWKLSSRIRLVLARLSLASDPALERELREMVRERTDLRLAPLRAEKERLEKRLEKVSRTLADHDRDAAAAVDGELAKVTKGLEASRAKARQLARRTKPGLGAAAASPAAKPAAGD